MKIGVPRSHGKRYRGNDKKIEKKRIFIAIIIVIIIALISIVSYNLLKENKLKENSEDQTEDNNIMNTVEIDDNVQETINGTGEVQELQEETIGSDLPDKMGNYKVIGELVIEKIGVKNNILEKYTEEALDLSVTKFYGVDINHVGNICLTGHNYARLLKRVKELSIGDTFYMINKEEATKVEYRIFDMYSCSPYDLDCLNPRYNGVKEVTIITCDPGGVTRLICKAREV